MSDFKTKADVLRALADGKRIKLAQADGYYYLSETRGLQHVAGGYEISPAGLIFCCSTDEYSLYVEPNLHTKGSYLWAREEHARGRTVRRDCTGCIASHKRWSDCMFTHESFIATDWQVYAEPA